MLMIQIKYPGSNLQPHDGVLPVAKGLVWVECPLFAPYGHEVLTNTLSRV